MNYISTRNSSNSFNFTDVFIKGLADDGGLYIPKSLHKYSQKDLNSFYALISLGIFVVILSMLFLCITGNSIFESFVFSIAALTNTGDGFLHINNVTLKENSKLFLILNFLMICGRFELIGYLLIFKKLSIKN